jgi:hypothetical protein
MSFADLKKNRAQSMSAILASAEKASTTGEKKSYTDERLWQPSVDKSGNGYAVIRFLPAAKGEDLPWVRYWTHGFQGPTGRWYIENSLTSIGKSDPVAELNSKLWNSGLESDKERVREQKRKLHYVANVLIISDPANPANDGQVRLFKFGKKIFDKILDLMQPQFQDEKPVNPFDFWEGADFKLKIRNVEGYRNYDKSEFAAAAPLFGGDEAKLETIYNKLHPLKEFIDPTNYKSYEELSRKLAEVLGETGQPMTTAERVELADKQTEAPAPRAAAAPQARTAVPRTAETSEDDDADTLSYFAKLAKQD